MKMMHNYARYVVSLVFVLFVLMFSALFWASNHVPATSAITKLSAYCAQFINKFKAEVSRIDSCAARGLYNEIVVSIPQVDSVLVKQGESIQNRALCAYFIRHEARVHTRKLMDDRLSLGAIRLFDYVRYGQLDGPSFSYLKNEKSLSYKQIIMSAANTNEHVNSLCDD